MIEVRRAVRAEQESNTWCAKKYELDPQVMENKG